MNLHADLKPSLIDLEVGNTTTGGKQDVTSVQPERLSERDNMYCIYWIHLPIHKNIHTQGYIGITSNFEKRMTCHVTNNNKSHFKNAINKYNWNNLNKTIIFNNLSLNEVLHLEKLYRPVENIGWNSQRGGELGVDKGWYDIPENKIKHKLNTSIGTKLAIANEMPGDRSKRAINSWKNNRESYTNISRGSNNPRAILNEDQVKCIKCVLLKEGIKDYKIARMYSVKPHVINFIRKNVNWKHVICDSPDPSEKC